MNPKVVSASFYPRNKNFAIEVEHLATILPYLLKHSQVFEMSFFNKPPQTRQVGECGALVFFS